MICCLDMEGVLVPEIWINVAKKTKIKELRLTTRDIPDYDVLMKQRLRILAEHGLGLKEIQAVIATMQPIPGAVEFVAWLRRHFQVVILSDTFYEFALPMMPLLGNPALLCHKLVVDAEGRVTDYVIRQTDPKTKAVTAFKSLNYRVIAAGDSYNDIGMLGAADAGFLFHAPEKVINEFPQFVSVQTYDDLREKFRAASSRNLP